MISCSSEVLLICTGEEKQKANQKTPTLLKNCCYAIKQRYIAGCQKNLADTLEKGRAVKFKIKDMPIRKNKNHLAYAALAVSTTRPFPCSMQGSQIAGKLHSNAASAKQA